MALATTCPQCNTSFKVVPDQLKLRRGMVRCGVCQHVFSGIDYLRYVEDGARTRRRRSAEGGPPSTLIGTDTVTGEASPAGNGASPGPEPGARSPSAPPDDRGASKAPGATTPPPGLARPAANAGTTDLRPAAAMPAPGAGRPAAAPTPPPAGPTTIVPTTIAPSTMAPTTQGELRTAFFLPETVFQPTTQVDAPAPSRGPPTVVVPASLKRRASDQDQDQADEATTSGGGAGAGPGRRLAGGPEPEFPTLAVPAPLDAGDGLAPSVVPSAVPSTTPSVTPPAAPSSSNGLTEPATASTGFGESTQQGPPQQAHHAFGQDDLSPPPPQDAPPMTSDALLDQALAELEGDEPQRRPLAPDAGHPTATPGASSEPSRGPPLASPAGGPAEDAIDYFSPAERSRRGFSNRLSPLGTVVGLLLVILLIAQLGLIGRNWIAQSWPGGQATLGRLLAPLNLRIAPPRDLASLTIESFELQAGDTPEQLTMSALLRNHAGYDVQWPALELSLTDGEGSLLARKVILPADYLGEQPASGGSGQADVSSDALPPPSVIRAKAERPMRLVFAATDLNPAGYSVVLFYP